MSENRKQEKDIIGKQNKRMDKRLRERKRKKLETNTDEWEQETRKEIEGIE